MSHELFMHSKIEKRAHSRTHSMCDLFCKFLFENPKKIVAFQTAHNIWVIFSHVGIKTLDIRVLNKQTYKKAPMG